MSKKLFLAIGLAIAIIFSFSISLSFATENTMQNAGNDIEQLKLQYIGAVSTN